jgi:NADH:ubiquinone oxidoreductase subunit F (NADH-binding)
MKQNLLAQIKQAHLIGRGGAGFPTALKWEMVVRTKGRPKYVICNASEGEIGVFKDIYILKKHTDYVVKGMILAMDFLGTKEGYFYINKIYYRQVYLKLMFLIKKYARKGYKLHVFKERPSYIGGEETALLNAIEGKRLEPRLKPPFPVDSGLFGKPTLVHNVETLFNIAKVAEGKFEPKRFYSIAGKVRRPGVYYLADDLTIYQILEETGNLPRYDFFVQIGGSASGLVTNSKQAKTQKMIGAGSIEVYKTSVSPRKMLLEWFKFYTKESCGKCTPCREGSYQLWQLVKKSKRVPWKKILNIVETMGKTSFCGLGKSIMIPVKSYMKNILHK